MRKVSVALVRINRHFPRVKKIKDATRSVTIVVDSRSAQASQKNPRDCAMARAATKQMQLDGAIVLPSFTYLIKGNRAVRFITSKTASRELVSFDRGAGFMPGKYLLSKVSKSNRLNVRKGNPERPSGKFRYQRKKFHVHRTSNIRTVTNI